MDNPTPFQRNLATLAAYYRHYVGIKGPWSAIYRNQFAELPDEAGELYSQDHPHFSFLLSIQLGRPVWNTTRGYISHTGPFPN